MHSVLNSKRILSSLCHSMYSIKYLPTSSCYEQHRAIQRRKCYQYAEIAFAQIDNYLSLVVSAYLLKLNIEFASSMRLKL
jgi:hypothetical protein